MIIVTGATGKLGGLIVKSLLDRVPADRIGVSVRTPEKAGDLARAGVRVRRGDFADPPSLTSAFEGVSQLLLVSSNAQAHGGDPVAQHRAAIDAARAAGVKRIVYTSHMAADAASLFPPMQAHAATERLLQECGTPWTALRNGFYANALSMLTAGIGGSGVLAAPLDGKVSWTAHADLAVAAAAILLEDTSYEGPTPSLTAGQALDLDDVAALAANLYGHPVRREVVSDEEHAKRLQERGVPPGVIQIALSMFHAARAGEFAAVDPTLERLLGRTPLTVRDLLQAQP